MSFCEGRRPQNHSCCPADDPAPGIFTTPTLIQTILETTESVAYLSADTWCARQSRSQVRTAAHSWERMYLRQLRGIRCSTFMRRQRPRLPRLILCRFPLAENLGP